MLPFGGKMEDPLGKERAWGGWSIAWQLHDFEHNSLSYNFLPCRLPGLSEEMKGGN